MPHLFKPGQSGNPSGRPPGTKCYLTKLKEAVERFQEKKGEDLLDYAVEKAYYNIDFLKFILNKLIPQERRIGDSEPEPPDNTIPTIQPPEETNDDKTKNKKEEDTDF